jgi:ketosteroid isomerase-like protein
VSDLDELRALLAEWERGDFTGGPRLFADDVRFSGAQPEGQVEARGPEGIAHFMRRFLQDWDSYAVETHHVEDLGDGRYIATGTQHGKGKASAMAITAPVSIAVRMHAGRITQLEFFLERDQALEALGA